MSKTKQLMSGAVLDVTRSSHMFVPRCLVEGKKKTSTTFFDDDSEYDDAMNYGGMVYDAYWGWCSRKDLEEYYGEVFGNDMGESELEEKLREKDNWDVE